MSTAALTGLLEYLYGTLSPSNMRWVGEHLIEYSKKEESEQLRPYTMQEIDDMLDEAEAAFEAGDYLTNEEVFHHLKATTAEWTYKKDHPDPDFLTPTIMASSLRTVRK